MTDLPTAPLGTTDMEITRVGFGAWAIGGSGWFDAWGDQDDRESIATIQRAVEAGVNWIDTAPIYGLGHSEEVVGRALRDIPETDRPYVFTKAGVIWSDDPQQEPRLVGTRDSLRREVDASLRRLGVERIDLYQVHAPPTDGTPLEDYWQTFLDLKAEGKVRAIGLSNHDVAQLEAAETLGHVDSLQPQFSLIERSAAADVLPWCAANETGAIVYSPMASGLLTGAFSAERVASLPDNDWRRTGAQFQGDQLERNLSLVDTLRKVADQYDVPVPAIAVAWTLAFTGVTGAIVGARRPEQIGGWLPAAQLDLDEGDLESITAALDASGAGSGPTRP